MASYLFASAVQPTTSELVVCGVSRSDIVSERGDEGIARVRELTGGLGVESVLECVGHDLSMQTALGIFRPGGSVGRVGVPQHEQIATTRQPFFDDVTISGGPAPARAYIGELLPDVLEGRIEPGRAFDGAGSLQQVPRATAR